MPLISPTAHRKLVRTASEAHAEYVAARAEALRAGAAWRADRTGRNLLAREDALGAALAARFWVFDLRRRLAAATVEPFGGRLSPATMERHRRRHA